jgi:hypothetical protein
MDTQCSMVLSLLFLLLPVAVGFCDDQELALRQQALREARAKLDQLEQLQDRDQNAVSKTSLVDAKIAVVEAEIRLRQQEKRPAEQLLPLYREAARLERDQYEVFLRLRKNRLVKQAKFTYRYARATLARVRLEQAKENHELAADLLENLAAQYRRDIATYEVLRKKQAVLERDIQSIEKELSKTNSLLKEVIYQELMNQTHRLMLKMT